MALVVITATLNYECALGEGWDGRLIKGGGITKLSLHRC